MAQKAHQIGAGNPIIVAIIVATMAMTWKTSAVLPTREGLIWGAKPYLRSTNQPAQITASLPITTPTIHVGRLSYTTMSTRAVAMSTLSARGSRNTPEPEV